MVTPDSTGAPPKTSRFPGGGPPITIRGDNITVDFRGATLEGSDPAGPPDEARDTAIVIEGGATIIIANAHIHGYKIGIRSEEHTSELQSQSNIVCRLLLEQK